MMNFLTAAICSLLLQAISYPVGTVVRFTVTPITGYDFVRWEGDIGISANPLELALTPENLPNFPALDLIPVYARSDIVIVTIADDPRGVVSYEIISGEPPPPPPPPDPVCGNAVIETGEQCDDGNVVGGDECSATCESEAPPPPPSDLTVLHHGFYSQSGTLEYRKTLTQMPGGNSTLVLLVVSTDEIVSVSDEQGLYLKVSEAISDDVTQWTVGRAAVFYRPNVTAQLLTIAVRLNSDGVGSPHVFFDVVEVRGTVVPGQSSGAFAATGLPNPGVIATTAPAVIFSTTHVTGGLPTPGDGSTILTSTSSFWYVGTEYQIAPAAGAYATDFGGGSGRWVAAAAAFELR